MLFNKAAFQRLHLDAKLGPLSRKHWIGVAGIAVGGIWYYRRRQAAADTASAGDATTAGSTTDANGNIINNQGQATDAGTTPQSFYDPYTSGYGGQGYDLLLGAGGVARGGGAGNSSAQPAAAAVVAATAPGATNPAQPTAAPTNVSVTYNTTTQTVAPPHGRPAAVKPPTADRKKTHHNQVKKNLHNVKHGRPTKRIHTHQKGKQGFGGGGIVIH